MKYLSLFLSLFLVIGCSKRKDDGGSAHGEKDGGDQVAWRKASLLGYEVVTELPHDPDAFTQGLLLSGGDWLESTGDYGKSSIRRVEKKTGKILNKQDLDAKYFGEGLAELNGKLFQLTWENGKGFVYDSVTLEKTGEFSYRGEGWGLTTDGSSLILSDGTDKLRFLNPETFEVVRELSVTLRGNPVVSLNELEYVEGEIFANVWFTEQIVRIRPQDGKIVGIIDLTGIDRKEKRLDEQHVLNGIAYDPIEKSLYVTGKCWPKIYQIRLVPKSF